MSSSDNPSSPSKVMTILKKYLKSKALKENAKDTFIAYLGKNSNESDHEAFLEYLDSEYLSNACHKLNEDDAVKIGVYSLLDGMPTTSKGRPPSLSTVLDEKAYQDGNTATYDYYLGERRTREEEQEFRQRLAFIRDVFDFSIDEDRADSIANYMLGPVRQEDNEDNEEEEEEEEVPSEEEEVVSSEEEEEVPSEEEEEEDGREKKYRDDEPSESSSDSESEDDSNSENEDDRKYSSSSSSGRKSSSSSGRNSSSGGHHKSSGSSSGHKSSSSSHRHSRSRSPPRKTSDHHTKRSRR